MIDQEVVFGKIDINNIVIDERELSARLGYGIRISDINSHMDSVKKAASCRYAYMRTSVSVTGNECDFGFDKVYSKALATVLRECDEAYILALTLGIDIDRLISKSYVKSKADGFIIDAIASATAEGLADYVNEIIDKGLITTKRFSPGYSDLPLEFQASLLNRLNAAHTIGVSLTDSFMMTPKKSVTAVIGIKTRCYDEENL